MPSPRPREAKPFTRDLIRKVRETRKTPAIALTGFGMQEDVERAQNAGFDAHLTKPVNLQKLEATMWRLLQAAL
jgi:CheY-like chemotaxis protein